ncbi:arginine--tRNA ligase [bacterium]|nr:arginine--tRNA ligase [bacterium]
MIRAIQKKIETSLRDALRKLYQLEDPAIPESAYPDASMGDLSNTIALKLAKTLRKNPKVIAEEIASALPQIPEIEKVEVAGNGYLNFRLDRTVVAQELYQNRPVAEPLLPGKVIVEHTNINPNKAAHVGHLRNACLGDVLVRLLEFYGRKVEVQNYIDDTGVQLADVVLGFQRKDLSINDLPQIKEKIDYYFWDLYAETHHWIEESPENRVFRENTLKAMEERQEPTFSLSQEIARRIILSHLQTMFRLGITYQLLPHESDIIGLHFWQKTFELLKEKGTIVKVEEGKNKGCWIMSLSGSETFDDMQNPDKIIVRSNGTVTYVGKDIAYQLWKFGLLGLDFQYKIFDRNPDGSVIWTTSTSDGDPGAPSFGGADTVYNVIDQRQSYLQKVVAQGLQLLGYLEQASRSIHFSYEMVTLSPKTAAELGFTLSAEEQQKAFVEMSGRKGLGVKADDLLDRLEARALERILPLYPELPEEEKSSLAKIIAAGALRYFMLRYTRNTLITFDMDEALNFEGETGPYLQYAMVRSQSIFRKLSERGFNVSSRPAEDYLQSLKLLGGKDEESEDSWKMILEIIKMKDIIAVTLRSLEISYFAKYVFQLAQAFNNYYHKYSILHEPDEHKKLLRIAVVDLFRSAMEINLRLLGIPVPARM